MLLLLLLGLLVLGLGVGEADGCAPIGAGACGVLLPPGVGLGVLR